MERGQIRPPFGFLFARTTAFNFSDFYFYAFRRFLAKKAEISQKLSRRKAKKSISSCQVFLLKVFIPSWFKSLQSFKPIAFMVLEIYRRAYLTPSQLTSGNSAFYFFDTPENFMPSTPSPVCFFSWNSPMSEKSYISKMESENSG